MLLSGAVVIIGALVYLLSNPTKAAELGRIAFAMGLLVLLLHSDEVVGLLR